MQYDFDRVIDRNNTYCEKWDGRAAVFGTADLLPLWVADMDFAAPPAVVAAIKQRAMHPIFGYTSWPPDFYRAIINWLKKRHNWETKEEWLLVTPGVVPAIKAAILAYTEPGDKVIIQPPVYPPFFRAVEDNGRELVVNRLKKEKNRYTMDYDRLERLAGAHAKMMILCSPHNPVGRVWTGEELGRVGDFCLRNNILLVSDEIHSDIIFKGHKHLPVAALSSELALNTITCTAPSKTFNIPGLATAVVIIPDQVKFACFKKTVDALGIQASNIFGITALNAAYRYGEEWLEHLIDYLQGNLAFLEKFFAERIPGVKVVKPEGTFLVWLDCRDLGMTPEALQEFMIKEAQVALNDGRDYGPGGEGFQRINIACPRSLLKKALTRIERGIKKRQE